MIIIVAVENTMVIGIEVLERNVYLKDKYPKNDDLEQLLLLELYIKPGVEFRYKFSEYACMYICIYGGG